MRTTRDRSYVIALLVALAAPAIAAAQTGMGAGGGYGRGASGARLFDPGTVTTIQGEILEIQRIPRGLRGAGVHLLVSTGTEKLPVHLGPSFFVDEQPLKLAKGDRVEIKGSRVVLSGEPTLIAQEVTRDGESMVLRDANGLPVWRGAGWRNR